VPGFLEGMLRRNVYKMVRPTPCFGLLPNQTFSCKAFQLSYTDEPAPVFSGGPTFAHS